MTSARHPDQRMVAHGADQACPYGCCRTMSRADAKRLAKGRERNAVRSEINAGWLEYLYGLWGAKPRCPACRGVMLYWPAGDSWACADPDCVYAHGVPEDPS